MEGQSQQKADNEFAPIIKKIVLVNVALILYYLFPSFISFFFTLLLLFVLLADKPYEKLAAFISGKDQDSNPIDLINKYYNSFQAASLNIHLVAVVLAGVLAQICAILPSYFFVFIIAELFATWNLLVSFGVVELALSSVHKTSNALYKFMELIPRYRD